MLTTSLCLIQGVLYELLIGFMVVSSFFSVLLLSTCGRLSWPALLTTFGRTIKQWLIVWLTDRSISKSFLYHHCVVLYTVYVFYVRTAPVRSQHVAPWCTLRNSRPRLLLRLPLPIPTPLKLALLAQLVPCLFTSSSSLLLLLLLLSIRGCREIWAPTEWLTARRSYMRL